MATRPFASKQDDKPKKSDAQQVLDDMPLKMRRAMTPMILGGEVRGGVTRI